MCLSRFRISSPCCPHPGHHRWPPTAPASDTQNVFAHAIRDMDDPFTDAVSSRRCENPHGYHARDSKAAASMQTPPLLRTPPYALTPAGISTSLTHGTGFDATSTALWQADQNVAASPRSRCACPRLRHLQATIHSLRPPLQCPSRRFPCLSATTRYPSFCLAPISATCSQSRSWRWT